MHATPGSDCHQAKLPDAVRQKIAKALRDGGHCFLSPAMWDWVQAIHATGRTWFTSAELRRLTPTYDGRPRLRHRATCNRWIAAMVAGHAMVRDGWNVRLELAPYDPLKDPKVLAAFAFIEDHFKAVDPLIDGWCQLHGLRRGPDPDGQRVGAAAYRAIMREPAL